MSHGLIDHGTDINHTSTTAQRSTIGAGLVGTWRPIGPPPSMPPHVQQSHGFGQGFYQPTFPYSHESHDFRREAYNSTFFQNNGRTQSQRQNYHGGGRGRYNNNSYRGQGNRNWNGRGRWGGGWQNTTSYDGPHESKDYRSFSKKLRVGNIENDEIPGIHQYFKESFLKDPWAHLT
ncbi:14185_t:CDS:2 [Acaulospora morrowiae]|uniref:14185_t:CDS:1 n=1 Tax=Acaulospora morrowiae TaxID=94023 RepID=A0A9N9HYN0_9GLOM|nr:14185_t:CDS:2 [Acaulospora morrowiae]